MQLIHLVCLILIAGRGVSCICWILTLDSCPHLLPTARQWGCQFRSKEKEARDVLSLEYLLLHPLDGLILLVGVAVGLENINDEFYHLVEGEILNGKSDVFGHRGATCRTLAGMVLAVGHMCE